MTQKEIDRVTFTQRQVDWLERNYPEVLAMPQIPVDQVRFSAGQRSVVLEIRSRLQR